MIRHVFAFALLLGTLCAAPAALAQTPGSATVNVSATLQAGAAQVSIEASNADFGTVYIPNGSVPGAICLYSLLPGAGFVVVNEIEGETFQVVTSASGCGAEGSGILPAFTVACPDGLDIAYTFAATPGSDPDVWADMAITVGGPAPERYRVSDPAKLPVPASETFDRQCVNGTLEIETSLTQLYVRDGAEDGPADAGAFTLSADF